MENFDRFRQFNMMWPINNEQGRPSMEELFRAAIERRSNQIPMDAFRRPIG